MTEPQTEAGRALVREIPEDADGYIDPEGVRTAVLAIEAEATAAAEQRLRRDPWRCPKCGAPLHGTDVEHTSPPASPRQGEPVDGLDGARERVRTLERANGEVALLWAETNDRLGTLVAAARAVLACGVGNLSPPKYQRRVEAFDALDDAVDAAALSEPAEAEQKETS